MGLYPFCPKPIYPASNENNSRFTVVNDYVTANPEEFGLLLTAKEAVNEPVIDIEKNTQKKTLRQLKRKTKKKKLLGSFILKRKTHKFYMQKAFDQIDIK